MKKNYCIKTTIFLLFLNLILALPIQAQVTIGNNEKPEKYSLLQIKDKAAVEGEQPDAATAVTGGLLLPRVELEKKTELLPFVTPEVVAANDAEYQKKKLLHTGLIVYNLIENQEEDLCRGVNQWTGKEWECFQIKKGQAIFTINNCSTDIKVFGEYGNGVALTGSNYVAIKVNVEKIGTYSISATVTDSQNDNGYFFLASGEFMSLGEYTIILLGMGTPANFQTDEFTVAINGVRLNGENSPCTFNIQVKDTSIRPKYTMNCSLTQVQGEYYEEKVLDATNYIEVTLTVDPSSFTAPYEIETNEVDGIKFKGSGILTSSPQIVRLYGEGVPFDQRDKKFYIKTNSESSTATCIAEVFIIIPPKRLMAIGYTATRYGYNWAQVGGTSSNTTVGKITKSNWMITDPMNFGPLKTSIVRYSGFTNKGTAEFANEIATINNTDNLYLRRQGYYSGASMNTQFERDVLGYNDIKGMDIVVIGWTEQAGWNMTDAQADVLRRFCQQGGILLVFNESTALNTTLLRTFFQKSDITTVSGAANPAGSLYRFANNPTDPVLNGPFGNISGLLWGEDASTTRYATNLPLEEVELYSSNKNILSSASVEVENAATAFRHRELPFIWVGDGGFTSGSIDLIGVTSLTICPFLIGDKVINGVTYQNYPLPKVFGSSTNKAYNSVFAANAFAWCIKKAEELKRSLGN